MLDSRNMKKLLAIIVLGLLWFNSAAAGCGDDIKGEWKYTNNKTYVNYKFISSAEKWIKMTKVGLMTETEQKVIEKKVNIYVKPFGIASTRFYVGDLNLSVVKNGFRSCIYEKPSKSELKKKSKTNQDLIGKKKKKSSFEWWSIEWWSILVGLGVIALLGYIIVETNKSKSKKTRFRSTKTSEKNIIEIVWEGRETMSKTFWLYCILATLVVSFISGLLLASLGAMIFIAPVVMIIWSNTGLWRSSEIYKNQKLKNKQTYGWATAAKVYVVLNCITTLSQIGLLLNP